MISGILVGKNGLNLVRTDPILDFLSLLGFAYLMFLNGLEIDFSFPSNRDDNLSINNYFISLILSS
jgi:trk system potassium uptake protein TrkA